MLVNNIGFYRNWNLNSKQRNSFQLMQTDSFTLSFKGMKKNEFKGLDYAIVEKFKAPVQQFKTRDDFNSWAKSKVEQNYLSKDFRAWSDEITTQRKAIIQDWHNYMTIPDSAYSQNPAWELLVMEAITRDLKPNTDKLPPSLHQGALASTINQMQTTYAEKPLAQLSFSKIYKENVNRIYTSLIQESCSSDQGEGVWVKIPSKSNDKENFDANVDKLKALSHDNWCTKSINAEPYLSQGDFHVYLVDGMPKVGIRLVGNKIEEIQGVRNNGLIPIVYADIIQSYTNSNRLKGLEKDIKKSVEDKQEFLQIKEELAQAIEDKDYLTILNHPKFHCNAVVSEDDGLFYLSNYVPVDLPFTLADLGINENELFDNVAGINSDIDFSRTSITRIKNLKFIDENANFRYSQIKDTGSLEYICGSALIDPFETRINKNLVEVTRGLYTGYGTRGVDYSPSSIQMFYDAFELKPKCKEDIFDFLGIKYKKLENGTYQINSYCPAKIEQLSVLSDYYEDPYEVFDMTEDEFLSDVSVVEGDVDLSWRKHKCLGGIEVVGGNLKLCSVEFRDLGEVRYVGGDLYCVGSNLSSLGKLGRVEGNVDVAYSRNLESLGKLSYIGKNADFSNTGIVRASNLKHVGGIFDVAFSKFRKFDFLEFVGGKICVDKEQFEFFKNSKWKEQFKIKREHEL